MLFHPLPRHETRPRGAILMLKVRAGRMRALAGLGRTTRLPLSVWLSPFACRGTPG